MGLFDNMFEEQTPVPPAPVPQPQGLWHQVVAKWAGANGQAARAPAREEKPVAWTRTVPKLVAPDSNLIAQMGDLFEFNGRGVSDDPLWDASLIAQQLLLEAPFIARTFDAAEEWRQRTRRLCTWLNPHSGTDAELYLIDSLIFWYPELARYAHLRQGYGVVEARHDPRPTFGPFAGIPINEFDFDTLTRKHGILPMDHGGGLFDQHGRPENRLQSVLASLHLFSAGGFPAFVENRELMNQVPTIAVGALNDCVGIATAPSMSIRDLGQALTRLGVNKEERFRLLRMAHNATFRYNNMLMDRLEEECNGDHKEARIKFFLYRRRGLHVPNIRNLVEPIPLARVEERAKLYASMLADEQERCGSTVERRVVFHTLYQQCKAHELAVREQFERALPAFQEAINEADAFMKADFAQAQQDVQRAETVTLDDMCVNQRDRMWEAQRRGVSTVTVQRRGRVRIYIGQSTAYSFGKACRAANNAAERERWRKELTKRTRSKSESEADTLARRRATRKAVHGIRPMTVACQLRNVVVNGDETQLHFTISSSAPYLDRVFRVLVQAMYEKKWRAEGFDPPQFNGPGQAVLTHPDGRRLIVCYLAEFRTLAADWTETNQLMEPSPFVPEETKFLILQGIEEEDQAIRKERGTRPLPDDDLTRVIKRFENLIAQAKEKTNQPA